MKIGIISLGLIGGSLFKCLSRTEYEIYGVTRNKDSIEKAKHWADNVSDDINIISSCDVVFIASPINKTTEILDKLENIVSPNTIVLDCASVKEFVMQKQRPYKFIGSHPMAGTEFSGYDASFKELFEGAKWVLTPSKDISQSDIETVEKIIRKTGATTIITTAKEHDEAVSLISHMPAIVSRAIFKTAQGNPLALKLASSGFRDMTRLSMSNIEMIRDMQTYNKENIEKAVKEIIKNLNYLKDTQDINLIKEIKQQRELMYSSEGKNMTK